jgi:peptide/nickel transport system permease protein
LARVHPPPNTHGVDRAQHFQNWWMGTFPGLAIVSVVLAFNFLGDSLRDAFDPQSVTGQARGA